MTPLERLEFLADALEADAADEHGMMFDLNYWIIEGSVGEYTDLGRLGRNCGTAGCAVGLAMLLPELQAEGLDTSCWGKPMYRNLDSGYDSVTRFFDILHEEAYELFSQARYKDLPVKGAEGELAVAGRIRALVAQKRAACDRGSLTGGEAG